MKRIICLAACLLLLYSPALARRASNAPGGRPARGEIAVREEPRREPEQDPGHERYGDGG